MSYFKMHFHISFLSVLVCIRYSNLMYSLLC